MPKRLNSGCRDSGIERHCRPTSPGTVPLTNRTQARVRKPCLNEFSGTLSSKGVRKWGYNVNLTRYVDATIQIEQVIIASAAAFVRELSLEHRKSLSKGTVNVHKLRILNAELATYCQKKNALRKTAQSTILLMGNPEHIQHKCTTDASPRLRREPNTAEIKTKRGKI
ncbi:hypothetical protein B0H17DRAFT_1134590 [Mycena rosella]|uniref:Uncharacterized protein n=1 Tax=Mycena rosella TaxID=1033263 RepID=A0AAD7GDW3_MYCRO|nr:hypothetical protein B0H17DRAFT_1134590 [Mycena rosella]